MKTIRTLSVIAIAATALTARASIIPITSFSVTEGILIQGDERSLTLPTGGFMEIDSGRSDQIELYIRARTDIQPYRIRKINIRVVARKWRRLPVTIEMYRTRDRTYTFPQTMSLSTGLTFPPNYMTYTFNDEPSKLVSDRGYMIVRITAPGINRLFLDMVQFEVVTS
ncbi:MAG: hypothetical protein K1X67_01375 [Fimbriimonadaceae bacterium]|nr:hypothetical protein [Fimbriimonadaceae bacterium]